MFKPMTLSLGLAAALCLSSLGVAGHHDKPSAQGVFATEQVVPSEQCALPSGQDGCLDLCGPAKKHSICDLFGNLFKPRPKCYEYEWVLKKKRVHHGLFGLGDCGDVLGGCGVCGEAVPSAQCPSGQDLAAPQYMPTVSSGQAYAAPAPVTYGAGQIQPESQLAPVAPAAPADALVPPPAPTDEAAAPTASTGGLLYLAPAGN